MDNNKDTTEEEDEDVVVERNSSEDGDESSTSSDSFSAEVVFKYFYLKNNIATFDCLSTTRRMRSWSRG